MKYNILVLFCFCVTAAFAQPQKIDLPKILLPSPDAAALGKYGDIPVSHQTGVPGISIPLYQIATSRLSVPISLSYHAGGFRVDEIASSTGLGFSLVAGGSISRVVKGAADETPYGVLVNGIPTLESIKTKSCDWLVAAVQSCTSPDTESDEYNYSTPQGSGKFVYDNDLNPYLIPFKPVKISRATGTYVITEPDGTMYVFGEAEQTSFGDGSATGCTKSYTSAWHLTMIISADRSDTIFFEYEARAIYGIESAVMSETISNSSSGGQGDHTYLSSITQTTYFPKTLKRIVHSTGKVEFTFTDGRTDIGTSKGPKLNKIEVFQKAPSGTYSLLKSFEMGYGYFYSGDGSQTDSEYYRLRLEEVREKDKTGVSVKRHWMEYDNSLVLPRRNSYARDIFGFYNGKTSNNTLVRKNFINWAGVTVQMGNADREPSPQHAVACLLKSIHYPTGGSTRFYFGTHEFQYDESGVTTTVQGGGVRIESMETYDANNQIVGKQIYKYGAGESGKGSLLFYSQLLSIDYNVEEDLLATCPGYSMSKRYVFPAGTLFEISRFNGSAVLYTNVAHYTGTALSSNGKTEYEYDVFPDELEWWGSSNGNYFTKRSFPLRPDVHFEPSPMHFTLNSNEWKNGNLKSESIYALVSGQYKLVKQTVNTYDYSDLPPAYSLKVTEKWDKCISCNQFENPTDQFDQIDTKFFWLRYPIYSGKVLLTQSTTTDVAGQTFLSTSNTYTYNNPYHLQPTKVETVNSKGETFSIEKKYPLDVTLSGDQEVARLELVNRHQHSVTLEESVSKNGTLLNKVINNYKKQSNSTPLPSSVQMQIAANPIETKLQFHQYDANNNTLEQSASDGIRKSYVWGYNGRYPIAEVVGASIGNEVPNSEIVKVPVIQGYHELGVSKSTTLKSIGSITLAANESSVEVDYSIAFNTQNGAGVPSYLWVVELIFRNTATGSDVIHEMKAPESAIKTVPLPPSASYNVYYRSQYVQPVDIHINSISTNRGIMPVRRIFHTSFEDDQLNISTTARTGKQSRSGSFEFILPKETGDYILSWWQKTGAAEWQYNEQTITVTGIQTVVKTIGSSGSLIDEVRLYPKGSQMSTFTVEPELGISSATDANNLTLYYVYDEFGRLKFIKDNDGNVLKKHAYHYSGN